MVLGKRMLASVVLCAPCPSCKRKKKGWNVWSTGAPTGSSRIWCLMNPALTWQRADACHWWPILCCCPTGKSRPKLVMRLCATMSSENHKFCCRPWTVQLCGRRFARDLLALPRIFILLPPVGCKLFWRRAMRTLLTSNCYSMPPSCKVRTNYCCLVCAPSTGWATAWNGLPNI